MTKKAKQKPRLLTDEEREQYIRDLPSDIERYLKEGGTVTQLEPFKSPLKRAPNPAHRGYTGDLI